MQTRLMLAFLALLSPACSRNVPLPPRPTDANNVADYAGPNTLRNGQVGTVDSDSEAAKQWLREHGYLEH